MPQPLEATICSDLLKSIEEVSVEQKAKAFYILVATDQEPVSAYEMARSRLVAGEWPMYAGTRNVQTISAGDLCVIYAAGSGIGSRCFVGSAMIASVRTLAPRWESHPVLQQRSGEMGRVDQWVEPSGLAVSRSASKVLSLIEQNCWEYPIQVADVIAHLGFIRNKARWGQAFQGGCRAISKADYALLCGLGQ